ncbi:(Fe-S)-binding protein [Pueribacillus sp. YX66]|uniref:(Fe-S)-binding protein n=1 Tax=Pueribacillus sp. YX66 TaxID=3229242 RepID=UPI00358D3753
MTGPSLTFVIFALVAAAVSAYGVYAFIYSIYIRYRFMSLGKDTGEFKDWKERLRVTFRQVFGHSKILKDRKSGIMHLFIFYGFFVVQLGAFELIIKGFYPDFKWPFGELYPFYTLSQEFTVTAVLIAILYAAYRRFGERLPRLKQNVKATLVIYFIGGLMLSVLLSYAFEALWIGLEPSWIRPFSSMFEVIFGFVSSDAAYWLFYFFWWVHLLILLAFMVYVPQSKHAHLLFAPFNILFSRMGPPSKMLPIDFTDETAEEFGVGRVEDFTRGELLDLYACVECGRCTNMCPGSNTGKMLSPMHIMTKVREHLNEKGEVITEKSPWTTGRILGNPKGFIHMMEDVPFAHGAPEGFDPDPNLHTDIRPTLRHQSESYRLTEGNIMDINLIGNVVTEQEIWACTTCRNCEDQCPVGNEHLSLIYGMRRYLVLTQGSMPVEAQRMMSNYERQSNPWGISRKDRVKWRDERPDLAIPTVKETDDFEYLFWVGSMASYDDRSKKIAFDFVKIMNEAGVKFAILGNQERSTGDTIRRLGNEYLFQELAERNIKQIEKYNVKKIVTIDPHIYNVFKNEYPDFGLEGVEVIHHTQLIAQLIRENKISLTNELQERIVYHDSCYLGRYNGIYDVPRDILKAIPGVTLLEMDRNKEDGMCCGAGGARMWMEEDEGLRVNETRVKQAMNEKPTIIGSNCPYCLTMMDDGVKAFEAEHVQTYDLAELVAKALG